MGLCEGRLKLEMDSWYEVHGFSIYSVFVLITNRDVARICPLCSFVRSLICQGFVLGYTVKVMRYLLR